MPRKRAISPDRVVIDAKPSLDGHIVKSAQRVIEVFEFFNDLRAGATVADIATALKIPQSSTSVLLRSLHIMGYLYFDQDARTYCPTSRIALLGHWVEPQLVSEGPVIKMVRDLAEQTGFDSFLATRNKLFVQIIHREFAANPKSHSPIGSGAFLIRAATGHVLMSDMSDRDVTRLVVATNAQLEEDMEPVNSRELLDKLVQVRRDGYAIGSTQRGGDFLTIAVRLPDTLREPMVFGISEPAERLGTDLTHWVDVLKSAVRKYLIED